MKTKFKGFVKKIKNWLSSLSKWAQKNKLKLFASFCLTLLLFWSFTTCSKNKETASASQVSSETPILFIPSINLKYGGKDFSSTPFFLVSSSNEIGVYLQSYDNKTQYEKSNFNVFNGGTYATTSFARLKRYGIPNYDVNQYVGLGLYPYENFYLHLNTINFPNLSFDNTNDTMNYIFSNSTHMYITVGNYDINSSYVHNENYRGYISIRITNGIYVNGGSSLLCTIVIRDLYTFDNTYDLVSPNVQFLSPSVDINEYAKMQYNLGYSTGYSIGYLDGYDVGFSDGIDYSTDPTHFEPFYILVRGVSNFLNTQILGSISIGTLLSIGLGCILFGFAIKIFLGG